MKTIDSSGVFLLSRMYFCSEDFYKAKRNILVVKLGILTLYHLMKFMVLSCKIYRHPVKL